MCHTYYEEVRIEHHPKILGSCRLWYLIWVKSSIADLQRGSTARRTASSAACCMRTACCTPTEFCKRMGMRAPPGCTRGWLIDPTARWVLLWYRLLVVCLLYSTVTIPFQVAFEVNAGSFDLAVDVLFWIDIAINFRLGFMHGSVPGGFDQRLVMDSWRRFLHSLFLLPRVWLFQGWRAIRT